MEHDELLLEARRFRVVRRRQTSPTGKLHDRDVILHPGAVVILPLVEDDRVCLIRNYRAAVRDALIELPAGTLEPGEDPALTAARELEEETGYQSGRLELLNEFWMSPGILNEQMRLYLAADLTAGPSQREAGEEIENLVLPWAEALRLAESGQIADGKTLVGLLWYDRFRRGGANSTTT